MIFRRAEEKDCGRILELLLQVNNVHNDGRPDLFLRDKTKYTEEELKSIIADDSTPVFVAQDDDGSIPGYGFAVIQSHEKDNNWPNITTLYVDDICVDKSCRGKHVGTFIYQNLVEWARKKGCYNLTLNVWEKNPGARAFYEKMGMTVQKTGMETIL
ncbi:MAG TPA: GNAT family N-acetyltransferase [Treponema sp.]|jgi:GNAT superfamily N-acetyltransferase|nr:GNAT family N-acetyltransferase [Treponema sp.]HAK68689.1 GNAT family N-acetyltransferase [Treponema sp.]HBB42800.1 GNAT family N-acetyltransferase [Treponema sp.]HCA19194.1 GNAT family N-acetyltransferase [Treponema sp.]